MSIARKDLGSCMTSPVTTSRDALEQLHHNASKYLLAALLCITITEGNASGEVSATDGSAIVGFCRVNLESGSWYLLGLPLKPLPAATCKVESSDLNRISVSICDGGGWTDGRWTGYEARVASDGQTERFLIAQSGANWLERATHAPLKRGTVIEILPTLDEFFSGQTLPGEGQSCGDSVAVVVGDALESFNLTKNQGWVDRHGRSARFGIVAGSGLLMNLANSSSPRTLCFTGEWTAETFETSIRPGWNILSMPLAFGIRALASLNWQQAGAVAGMNMTESDTVTFVDSATGGYTSCWLSAVMNGWCWENSIEDANQSSLQPFAGYLYHHAGPGFKLTITK